MNTRWFDLKTEQLEDATIRLRQSSGNDEQHVIDLHPEQLRHISRQAFGMKLETSEKVSDLERRIAVLTDKLQRICCDSVFRSDLCDGLERGSEYLAKLDGLIDLALEFDGGRLEADE